MSIDTNIQIYSKSLEVVKNGAEILKASETTVTKALAHGEKLLAEIEANEGVLNAELDQKCNDYLVRCRDRKKELNDNRKPVTQVLDVIKKMYTEYETSLDIKKGPIPVKLNAYRQAYATRLFNEEQEKKKAEELRQATELEMNTALADARKLAVAYFVDRATKHVNKGTATLNEMTLETVQTTKEQLDKMAKARFSKKMFAEFSVTESDVSIKLNEWDDFIAQWEPSFQTLYEEMETNVNELIKDGYVVINDNILSHLNHLNEMKRADDAKKKELEQEQEKRAAEQKKEQEKQAEALKNAEETKANTDADVGAINTLFNGKATATAEVVEKAPETRKNYEITVNSPEGYSLIFAYFMQNQGIALTHEALCKTSIGKMIKFAEKQAHSTGEKITGEHITYTEVVTSVTRKTKAQ